MRPREVLKADDDGEDREHPQDRAAVGEQEEHDHDEQRGEEQVAVEPGNASAESAAWPPAPASRTVPPSILAILWISLPMSGILFSRRTRG